MILTLLGVADMHAFIGIDDAPFGILLSCGESSDGFGPAARARKRAFVEAFKEAFKCDWSLVSPKPPELELAHVPILGKGVEITLPEGGWFAEAIRTTAIAFVRGNGWDTYGYIFDEGIMQKPRDFDPEKVEAILTQAKIIPSLWIKSPGCISLHIDIESSDEDFVHYWYPIYSAVEFSTYHADSLQPVFSGSDDEGGFEEATKQIESAGAVNHALRMFRTALCDLIPEAVRREVSKEVVDEIETGFYTLLRCTHTENWREAVKMATAHNEYVQLEQIKSDPYTTFVGWSAGCIVTNKTKGGDDERALYDLKVAVVVYNLFYFYEAYLSLLLSHHVYLDKPKLDPADLITQRRFGQALHFLADLRRASQYGSDRRIFEAWIQITDLDRLREKTGDGLTQILSSLEELHKRRSAFLARWLGVTISIIGFTSILGWVTSLQDYFKSTMGNDPSGNELLPPHLGIFLFSSTPGRWVLMVYMLGLAAILAAGVLSYVAYSWSYRIKRPRTNRQF